jgi:hypothetical protein
VLTVFAVGVGITVVAPAGLTSCALEAREDDAGFGGVSALTALGAGAQLVRPLTMSTKFIRMFITVKRNPESGAQGLPQ